MQTQYLFIGGPWDQRWHDAFGGLDVVRVPTGRIRGDFIRGASVETVLYYRTRGTAPGWLVPFTVYIADPLLPAPAGTPLLGWVEGQRPDCAPDGAWRYLDDNGYPHAVRALHRAIRARGCRP